MTCWRLYYVALIYCAVIQIYIVYGQDFTKSSLTFVIDDSGSMSDEIEQVKSSVDSIFDTVMESNASQIENFVLVTFNDPDYIVYAVTKDRAEFKAAASKVNIRDGIPECPEKAMTGIKVAMEHSLPLSTLYVFTDASAKDSQLYEEVKSMAHKKQIQVTFMLTGDCGSRESKRYQVYHQLAKATSGEVFNLMKADIVNILEYVKENTKSRSDIIESKTFPPGYGNKLTYSVDSKMNDLIISVTGLKPQIEVIDSEGKKVEVKHIVNKDEIAIVKATKLKPGVYTADVGSTSETFVKVMGKTSVTFYYGFSPFETNSLSDTATRPAADGDAHLSIKLQGEGVKLETVKIFDMDGNVLQELPLRLINETERFYVTEAFHPPTVAFKLSVFGYVEENKSLIKRTSATPIERPKVIYEPAVNTPPLTTITEGSTIFLDYRSPLRLKCKVHGYPKPDIVWLEKDTGVTLPSNVNTIEAPYDFMSSLYIDKLNKNSTYECKAHNLYGTHISSIKVETNIYLNILETPSDKIEVEYGKECKLRCIIDASPPASIGWYNNGSLLSNDTNVVISSDMGTLTIKQTTLESQGTFMCEIKNDFYWKSFFSKVTVSGLEKPVIDKPDEKIRAEKGTDVQLTCRILHGKPKPTLSWHFQDRKGNKFKEAETNESLMLKNVSLDDEGTYMCNASNILGSESNVMDLTVEYVPIIKDDGIKMIKAKAADQVTLPCNVDGEPTPVVKWLKNGIALHSSKNIFITNTDHSLKFKKIEVSDAGQYTCEAENYLGSSNKLIFVNVFDKPVLDKPDKEIRVVKGAEGQLTCRILRGTPKPTIQWHFQQRKAKKFRELKETDEVLLLKNVQFDDEGTYKCNASNRVGSQSYTMDLTVEYPPIIKDVIKMIEAKESDQVILPCNVDGVPTPTVKWMKNHMNIPRSKNILTTTDHSLIFITIEVSDAGLYTCDAENYLGFSEKSTFVTVFEKPVLDKPDEKKSVLRGDVVELTCRILRGTPKPTMQWYFQNEKAKNFKVLMETDETLLLKNVKLDDVGTYKCNASNKVGSQSYTIDLTVEYPPTIIDDGIKMIQPEFGDPVTLSCNVNGLPTPTVNWVKDGATLHSSKDIFITSDNSLKFRTIKMSDTGQYTCEAQNHRGSSKKNIFVYVLEKPVIDKPDEKKSVVKGDDVLLKCRILRGTPKPTIQWHFRQRKIKKFRKLKETDEALLLKNVKLDDEGTYRCNASNTVGSQSYTMDLIVEYPPTIIDDGIKMIQAESGDPVTLPCNVDGFPTPTVKWLKYSTTLRNSRDVFTTTDNSLKFKTIRVSDTGHYTCEAENRLGPSRKSIFVNVFEKPVLDRPDKKKRALKGDDVHLICRILRGTPKPTMQWHFKQWKSKIFRKLAETNEALLLKNVKVDNMGTYQCNASNAIGSQIYTMDLTVEYPPTIIDDGIKVIQAKAGDEITLTCNVDGIPTPIVNWVKGSATLHGSKKFLTTSDHGLKIRAVELPNTGYYTCEARNYLGSSKKTIFVDVFVPATIEIPKSSVIDIMVGRDRILPCHADGYPYPEIKWFYQNFDTKIPEIELRSNNKAIGYELRHIQLGNQGYYTCVARNFGGSSSITYTVNVNAPPIIQNLYTVKTFTCVKGDLALRIQCKAIGYPKPVIDWKKDNINILRGSGWYDIDVDGTLVIKAIEKRKQGYYTCLAKNGIGSDSVVYKVIVNDYPIVSKQRKTMFISPGNFYDVICDLPHEKTDFIRWYKDSRLIKYGELKIASATYLDIGIYTCRVSNMSKSHSAHVEIKMGYKPFFTSTVSGTDITFKNGSFYPLICLAKGEPTPKITWNYNGKRLDAVEMIYNIEMTFKNRGTYTCEISNSFGPIQRSFRIIAEDCILDVEKDLLHDKQPMILTPKNSWPIFPIMDGFMIIEKSDFFYLHCPNGFARFHLNFLSTFCVGGTEIKINGVNYEYSKIKCKRDIKPVIRESKDRCLFDKTVSVEVGYNIYRKFLNVFSVCLDKNKNVPLYTRYTLSPAHYGVSATKNVWYSHKLVPYNFNNIYSCKNQARDISSTLQRPFNTKNACCFGKTQLVNPKDLHPGIPTSTVYTYLNVVPHWSTYHSKNWANIEQKVRNLAKILNNELIILTGTTRPLKMTGRSGYRNIAFHDRRGKKYPVTQYLWKVVQDPVSSRSLAIVQVNVPDLSQADVPSHIHCIDICNNIHWMKDTNWHNVADGYTYCCSILDFESAFNFKGKFSLTNTALLNLP